MFKKIHKFIDNRVQDNALDQLNKLGYQQKNQFLINQGYVKPSQNLKALKIAYGDEQVAMKILEEKKVSKEEKQQFKKEKIEMKINNREEKQKNKTANKLLKYQLQLENLQLKVNQYKLQEKILYFKQLGYDNQVKIIKALVKFNGNNDQTLDFVQRKSKWNVNKFKLIGIGSADQNNAQTQITDTTNSSNYQKQQSQNFQYPHQSQMHSQQNYNPNQNKQQPFQFYEEKISNNSNQPIPANVDVDAYTQMLASKQEEIKYEAPNFNYPQNPNETQTSFKDEDVEIYIKKNQFLISQGFRKADENLEALLRNNGDEQLALKSLVYKQQQKFDKKSKRYSNQGNNNRARGNNNEMEEESSSSSNSDD